MTCAMHNVKFNSYMPELSLLPMDQVDRAAVEFPFGSERGTLQLSAPGHLIQRA